MRASARASATCFLGFVLAACAVTGACWCVSSVDTVAVASVPAQPAQPAMQPVIELPAAVQVKAGRLVKLTAKTTGKTVRWVLASDEADLIVSETGTWAIFSSPTPGKYLVLAWTALGGEPSEAARCWITVGDGPGPPDPAEPTDALYPALKAAFRADAGTADRARVLAQVYRQAVKLLPQYPTVGPFIAKCHDAAETVLGAGKYPKLRRALADELNARVPATAAQPLTPELQGRYAEQFNRFATLLEALQ